MIDAFIYGIICRRVQTFRFFVVVGVVVVAVVCLPNSYMKSHIKVDITEYVIKSPSLKLY